MKVRLLSTVLIHGGKTYSKGDILDVNEYVYNTHITRFEKVAKKPTKSKKVIHNDEPQKEKTEEKTVTKKQSKKKG